jgi:predicted peptidase
MTAVTPALETPLKRARNALMHPTRFQSLLFSLVLVATASAKDPAPGQQVEQNFTTTDGAEVPYLLYLPEDYSSNQPVPMILFLHGRGESNGPLSIVAKWGPPRRLAQGEQMKYIVASPQCPRNSFWSHDEQQRRLLELLAHLQKQYTIDPDRIYLTGLSMGGFGTWRMAADHPEKFAAAVPVCGRGDPRSASRLIHLPIWAWHGTEDQAVPFERSVEMVEAIRAAGGTKVRFTSLEHVGHASWQAAYQSDDVYAWLDRQRASQNRSPNGDLTE